MWYLGIDGGGTKTEFLLLNENGERINRIFLGSSNPVDIGIEHTLTLLKQGIDAVCDGENLRRTSVYAGIAGSVAGNQHEIICSFLASMGFSRVGAGSDIHTAVAACLGSKDGVAVIMGTGSIAFSQKNGMTKRIGGFGYLFDTGGSGYAIGRDGIIAALRSEEGSLPYTSLESKLKEKYQTDHLWALLPTLYSGGKKEIASFAPLVMDAAAEQDATAEEVLCRNMEAIGQNINDALQEFSAAKPIPVVLIGGLTNRAELLLPMIQKHINHNAMLSVCPHSVVCGALLLAGLEEKYVKNRNAK